MPVSELDSIVQRVVDDHPGRVVDVAVLSERVLAELPPRLIARVTRRQVRDRVLMAATRKAARSAGLAKAG